MSVEVGEDNTEKFKTELEKAIEKALIQAGGLVRAAAVGLAPKDTGLLQNSITYALGGESPEDSSYMDDAGKQVGHYTGTAPADPAGEYSVYVGTNVEYAA